MENKNIILENIYANKIYQNDGNVEVLNQVKKNQSHILDIGCGAGDIARKLKKEGKTVVGITISESEAVLARKVCDEVIIANIETDNLSFEKKFDAIILSHVCEHLVYPTLAIEKTLSFLSEDGTIIVAVPNMAFYKNRGRLLKGNWNLDETGPFDKTHLHFYSYNSADIIAESALIKIDRKVAGSLAVPLWPIRKIFPKLSSKIDNLIGNRFPNLFSQQTILILSKSK